MSVCMLFMCPIVVSRRKPLHPHNPSSITFGSSRATTPACSPARRGLQSLYIFGREAVIGRRRAPPSDRLRSHTRSSVERSTQKKTTTIILPALID